MAKEKVGRPLAFNSAEELERKIDEYFNSDDAYLISSDETKIYTPTMSGLALHIGVDRRTIVNYTKKEEYFPTIKKARARIESHYESLVVIRDMYPTINKQTCH